MLYISSATNDPWPHPLHLSSLLFLFVSHYQDSFSKTHNHLCSCSSHPEILTCVSSVVLLNVHTWINVCCLCSFSDSWGSYIVCFVCAKWCRVCVEFSRKHWVNVWKQVKCVKSFEKRVFVSRTVWMVWKIVPMNQLWCVSNREKTVMVNGIGLMSAMEGSERLFYSSPDRPRNMHVESDSESY